MPRKLYGFSASSSVVGVLVQIRNQRDDAAALEVLRQQRQVREQAARPLGRRRDRACAADTLKCFADGGTCATIVLIERDDARRGRAGGATGRPGRPPDTCRTRASTRPGSRTPIDFDTSRSTAEVGVGVGLVLLDEVPIGPRVQPPVDAPDVVAGHVAAMLGEVDRRAEVRRPVQAVDEAIDDRPREQLEVLDAREDLRVDEPGAGNERAFPCVRRTGLRTETRLSAYIPDLRQRHRLQQLVDERVARDAFRLGAEVREHAVAQHRDAPAP